MKMNVFNRFFAVVVFAVQGCEYVLKCSVGKLIFNVF